MGFSLHSNSKFASKNENPFEAARRSDPHRHRMGEILDRMALTIGLGLDNAIIVPRGQDARLPVWTVGPLPDLAAAMASITTSLAEMVERRGPPHLQL